MNLLLLLTDNGFDALQIVPSFFTHSAWRLLQVNVIMQAAYP